MDPERQAVAGAADRGEHLRQLIAAVARDVQDRPELLALQLIESSQLDEVRWEEVPLRSEPWVELTGVQQLRLTTHALGVPPQARPRCLPDHGADIGRHFRR